MQQSQRLACAVTTASDRLDRILFMVEKQGKTSSLLILSFPVRVRSSPLLLIPFCHHPLPYSLTYATVCKRFSTFPASYIPVSSPAPYSTGPTIKAAPRPCRPFPGLWLNSSLVKDTTSIDVGTYLMIENLCGKERIIPIAQHISAIIILHFYINTPYI